MFRKLVIAILVLLPSASQAVDESRFFLKGSITRDLGVAMIQDSATGKTLFVKVGSMIPGSRAKLISVDRKSAEVLEDGRKIVLYRNAWDGESGSSSHEYARPNLDRLGRDETSENFEDGEVAATRDTYRAPPPPPPLLPNDGSEVDDGEDYDDHQMRGKRPYKRGRVVLPEDDESINEGIPGIYPEYED